MSFASFRLKKPTHRRLSRDPKMFLILSLFVIIFIFWFSSFLAEIILSSKQENLLNPGVRSGIGFFISVAYFSASWQVMTIQNAWKLGAIILILYAYGKYGHPDFKNITSFFKNFFSCLNKSLISL